MQILHFQKSLKVFRTLRTSLHRKKINDLNKQQRLPIARFTHSLDELAQPGNKSIIADSKQWTTRNIAHTRRLNNKHTRPPFSKTAVPVEILLRDKAVLGRAPGHHRRYPRTTPCLELPYRNRTEEPRLSRFFCRGPARLEYLVPDWIRKFPHV